MWFLFLFNFSWVITKSFDIKESILYFTTEETTLLSFIFLNSCLILKVPSLGIIYITLPQSFLTCKSLLISSLFYLSLGMYFNHLHIKWDSSYVQWFSLKILYVYHHISWKNNLDSCFLILWGTFTSQFFWNIASTQLVHYKLSFTLMTKYSQMKCLYLEFDCA